MSCYVNSTTGAKFEEHSFNISRDILYSVFYDSSCKPYNVITYPIYINMNIPKTEKDIL